VAASSDDRGNERAGGGDGEQEERTDGWMATYADMVTLLLTFFVLMFALSNVDNEKAELFLAAMSRGGITADQFMEIRDRYDPSDFDGSEWDDQFPTPGSWGDDGNEDPDEGETEAERKLRELAEAIQSYIDDEGLGNVVEVTFNGDYLMLTLANDVWFESARADVNDDMIERAVVLGVLIADNFSVAEPFEIIVAGHTDDVPITRPFPSNWHLSFARAQNFMELLIESSGLGPWNFMAYALGEYRPIASNDTEEGRQRNRRVEIMITRARENPLWDN